MRFRLECGGCGSSPADGELLPFRCPHAGQGDVDHVLQRVATGSLDGEEARRSDEPNPFLRFRALSYSYDWARSRGLSDGDYCEIVRRLDARVAEVDGRGFSITRLIDRDPLYVKDETGNVGGSHKGRHLMGIALHLEVVTRLGHPIDAPLAIASCGNAALAAAVVARAAGRTLRVFVPTSADAEVVERLRLLGAEVAVCPRQAGVMGDPAYLAFRAAVDAGAVPFSCQGGDNGLTLDGGRTLGYELALQLGGRALDHLFIQVGGGALASSTISALREAVVMGWLARLPRIHAVQTLGAFPLQRAWQKISARSGALDERMSWAATHRSQLMWPWEDEPHSIAHGILDDETYDWLAIVRGLGESDGECVLVEEAQLERATVEGRQIGVDVDATGAAGLAGLRAAPVPAGQSVAVIFSGGSRRR